MGKKRKPEKNEDEIRRKIKKLENQLAKRTPVNGDTPCEENSNHVPSDTPSTEAIYCVSPVNDTFQYYEASPDRYSPSPNSSPQNAPPQPATSPQQQPATAPQQQSAQPQSASSPLLPEAASSTESSKVATEELELDEEILQLLGDAPKPETPLGSPIHKDVARRWQEILAKGLSKEVKDNLLKEYLIPSNCELLLPAALNPEVKAALPDTLVKRDAALAHKQKQLGIALAALGRVTELILANETTKQKLLKPLSDACRILCDHHYSDTKTRRGFAINSINTKLREALIESSRDKYLFGENIAEKLKVAKTIQQSGEALKSTQKPKFQRQNAASTSGNNNKNRLNYAPQHRKTDNKPNDSRRAPNYPQRQTGNNNARRPTDRPQPTRTSASNRR